MKEKEMGDRMKKIKLISLLTGQWTTVKNDNDGIPNYQEAADRLVQRQLGKEYFASRYAGWFNLPTIFEAEPCRNVGGMDEHTNWKWRFRIIK